MKYEKATCCEFWIWFRFFQLLIHVPTCYLLSFDHSQSVFVQLLYSSNSLPILNNFFQLNTKGMADTKRRSQSKGISLLYLDEFRVCMHSSSLEKRLLVILFGNLSLNSTIVSSRNTFDFLQFVRSFFLYVSLRFFIAICLFSCSNRGRAREVCMLLRVDAVSYHEGRLAYIFGILTSFK